MRFQRPISLCLAALACALAAAAVAVAQTNEPAVLEGSNGRVAEQPAGPNALLGRLQAMVGRATDGASKALDNFMRPKQELFQLVQRYHKFYADYAALARDRRDLQLAPANDFIAAQFSLVERQLFRELLEVERARLEREHRELDEVALVKSLETGDFLFAALRRLIEALEARLADFNRLDLGLSFRLVLPSSDGGEEPEATSGRHPVMSRQRVEAIKASAEFNESMDRLRRIGARMVRDLLGGELLMVSRVAVLNALATYLAGAPPLPASSPLSLVAPLVQMLGAANTPLASSYLTNVEIRAFLSLMDGLNPVPRLVDELFKRSPFHNNNNNNNNNNKRPRDEALALQEGGKVGDGDNVDCTTCKRPRQ